jgi:hypothetical protein
VPQSTLRIIYNASEAYWKLDADGEVLGSFSTQSGALEAGWRRGETLVVQGRGSRLIVHAQDGAVESEFPFEPAHSRSDV